MKKRDRQLKQRLEELFSAPVEPEAEVTAPVEMLPAEVVAEAAPETSVKDEAPIEPAASGVEDLARLKILLDQIPLPVYLKDREHTWIAMTAAFGQIIGYAPASLLGHTDKEQDDESWQRDDRVLETGQPVEVQETTSQPDGSTRIRRLCHTPVFNNQHEVDYVMGVIHEAITPPPARQMPAFDSDETFHAAIDALPNSVMISRLSDDTIVYINAAFCRMFGCDPHDLQGKTTEQVYDEPATHAQIVDKIRREGYLSDFEAQARHADGHRFWVSLNLQTTQFNGEPCVLTNLLDITAHKHTERELLRFKLGIERSTAAIFITDRDGTILYVNPAFESTYGFTPDEAIGRTPRILKSGLLSLEQYKHFWGTLLSGGTVTGEIINKAKDGRLVPIEGSNNPIFDEAGQIIGFLAMHHDNSQHKQAENDLMERNKQLTTFNQLGQALNRLLTPSEIYETLFNTVGEILDNRNLYIATYDEASHEIHFPIYSMDGERRKVLSRPFGNGITEYIIRTKTPLLIAHNVQRELAQLSIASIGRAARSFLGVPLLSGDKVTGVIAIQDYEKENVYSLSHVELLSTIAAQTATALENAQLYTAQSKRALQLQTAAEISSAVSSILNVDELVPYVVHLMQARFGLYYVGLFLLDEKRQNAVLRAGTGEAGRLMLEHKHQLALDDYSMVSWAIQHQTARIALDVGDDAMRFNNPLLPDTRSELAVPLVSRGQVLGAMTVQSSEVAAFKEQDVVVLQTMADQIATAIANAQLFEQVDLAHQQAELRVREVQFSQRVGRQISSSLNLAQVLDDIFHALEQDMGFTHIAMALFDRQAGLATIPRAAGTAHELEGLSRPLAQLEHDILMDIAHRGQPEVIDGWDARFDRDIYESQGHAALVRAFVPLLLQNECIGILEVGYRRAERARITDDEVRLLTGLADQIALAVANARLFTQSQRRITEMSVLNEIGRSFTTNQDEEALYQIIHQQVGRLYDASSFFIARYNSSDTWTTAFVMLRGERQLSAQHSLTAGLTGHILNTHEALLFHTSQELKSFMEKLGQEMLGTPAHSWMGVPLIAGDRTVGVMGIQDLERDHVYSEQDLQAFATIGTQVAAALHNLQLFKETQTRANELAALNNLSQELSAQLDTQQVLEAVHAGVSRLLDTTNFYIGLYDPERHEVSFVINVTESAIDKEIAVLSADQGLTGYIIRTKEPLLISEGVSTWRAQHGLPGVGQDAQSWLGVPLLLANQVLGVMAIQSYTLSRIYAAHDRDMLIAIASQTAIALQNARLFEQTQKQAREAAAVNEILQEVSHRVELEQILETSYQHIRQLVPADAFIVALYDSQTKRLWYPLIYDNQQRYPVREGDISASTHINQVITTRQPILIHRTPEEIAKIGSGSVSALGNTDRPSASLLYVPLKSEQKIVGAVSVQSYQLNAYTPEYVDLITRITNQIAIAVQNAELLEKAQHNARQLAALNEFGQTLSTQLEINDVLEVTYQHVQHLAPVDSCLIVLHDPRTNTASYPLIYDEGKRYPAFSEPLNPDSIVGKVMLSGEPSLVLETADSLAAMTEVRGAIGNTERPSASLLYVPLKIGKRPIGVLSIQSYQFNAYTSEHLEVFGSVANQVAVAIQNARLFEQTRRTARREQTLREITARVRSSTDPEIIMRAAVRELGSVLGRETFIRLGDAEQLSQPVAPPAKGAGSDLGDGSEGGQ